MNKNLIRQSFFLALSEGIYIFLVALFFFGMQKFFGDKPDPKIFAPIIGLLLLVISASISGALILGKPVILYLDGQKKEALQLFGLNIVWLVVLFIIAFIIVVTR